MENEFLSSATLHSNLPESYVRPESQRPRLSEVSNCENVPVINVACDDRSLIVQKIGDNCERYGFFQHINHGVREPTLNTEKVHNWRDYIRLHSYPHQKNVLEGPSNPTSFNQPASPALNSTSSASDQNANASTLAENNRDGDEQPLPYRSPSDMENGEASSQTDRKNKRTLLNYLKVAKACLVISGEVGLASAAIRFTSTKALSHSASILLTLAELCSVVGFFLCLCGYALQSTNRNNRRGEATAELLTRVGSVVTACSFLSFMGTQFPEDIMLWLTGAICMIPISVLAFMI